MSSTYPNLGNTTFPQNIQTFKTWADLSASDATNYELYMEKLANKDTVGAKSALQAITDYKKKIISAADFNQICDTIVAVEQFYLDAETGDNPAFQAIINNQLVYSGAWSSATTYKQFNMVFYSSSNTSSDIYISLQNGNLNHAPTGAVADTYWAKVSVSGITNNGTTWRGNWTAGTYSNSDMVAHNNQWWICVATTTTTSEPSTSAADWVSVLNFNNYKPVVSSVTPIGQGEGSFWYHIL